MRRLSRLVVAASVALLVAGLMQTPAQAAVGDLTCTVSNNSAFTPGLRLVEQQTHIAYDVGYSDCTSMSHPEITSGSHSGTFDGPRGCLSLPPSHTPTVTITWNTGETSTIAATASGYDAGGQTLHTITGTVIDGVFADAVFAELIVQVNPKLTQCLASPGVTSQTGLGAVSIS